MHNKTMLAVAALAVVSLAGTAQAYSFTPTKTNFAATGTLMLTAAGNTVGCDTNLGGKDRVEGDSVDHLRHVQRRQPGVQVDHTDRPALEDHREKRHQGDHHECRRNGRRRLLRPDQGHHHGQSRGRLHLQQCQVERRMRN